MEQIKVLLTAMEQNAALAKEISELMISGDAKAVIDTAGKHGITLSQEDWEAYLEWNKKTVKPAGKTELMPEELNRISGGAGGNWHKPPTPENSGGSGTIADPYHSGCWFYNPGYEGDLANTDVSQRSKCKQFSCKAIPAGSLEWFICGCWGTFRCNGGFHERFPGGCQLEQSKKGAGN